MRETAKTSFRIILMVYTNKSGKHKQRRARSKFKISKVCWKVSLKKAILSRIVATMLESPVSREKLEAIAHPVPTKHLRFLESTELRRSQFTPSSWRPITFSKKMKFGRKLQIWKDSLVSKNS